MSATRDQGPFTGADADAMRLALAQASLGAGGTHPNPAVGAVVVREGTVVGKGFHRGPGTAHAEVVALEEAGEKARGADLFVTLEPCCTWGRTPPCTRAILAAGVTRVVAACLDPNPDVRGGGLRVLRLGGLAAESGLLEREGVAADLAYHHFYAKGRPWVHLKWAQSLDGRAELPGGGAITGPEAHARVHRDRSLADAILVSAGTILNDAPRLTVREGFGPKRLLRIILDRRGRIRGTEAIFSTGREGDIWVIRPESSAAEPFRTGPGTSLRTVSDRTDGGWDLEGVLRLLAGEKVMALYAEAVGRLSAQFLAQGLVDRLSIHLAPRLAGGEGTPALGTGQSPGEDLPDLGASAWERLGSDWVVTTDIPDARSFHGGGSCSRG